MKKILIAFIAVFTLGALQTATAQKFGHIDYLAVMDSLDTYKKAMKTSEELNAEFEANMKSLQQEYEKKYSAYLEEAESLPPIIRQQREKELTDIQATSEQMQRTHQRDLQTVQERYFGPLEKWLKEATGIVGKRKGLDYILYYDKDNSIFWVNPDKGTDVTNEVITEMLKLEAANPID